MTTAAARTPGRGRRDPELTVDELAARVGVTVRNVRAYSARGLLPPPRMVGRTGYYGREHVARLLLVREMLAEGYSLAMIERTLASAPPTASSATLALHRALLAPWLPPEPEITTGAELAARAGVPETPGSSTSSSSLGLVERLDDGGLRVLDPALLTAGLQVVALGVPPDELIAAQARVNEHVREIAQTYVQMFLAHRPAGVRRGRSAAGAAGAGAGHRRPPPAGRGAGGAGRVPHGDGGGGRGDGGDGAQSARGGAGSADLLAPHRRADRPRRPPRGR